ASLLREIGIASILKQSSLARRSVGFARYFVLLHFVYMLVMHKRQSSFLKQSSDAFGKDVYYRFLRERRFNWRKLLMLSTIKLIQKVEALHRDDEQRLLIIDDTVEPKRGKQIEGSCQYVRSNKEHRSINGLNVVSLNYADSHSTFQLDFALRMNESRRKELADFSQGLHHRSNAFKRRQEGLRGKNILALEMVERALNSGVVADYLPVDSWYAKPEFICKARTTGIDVIARLPNNPKIWHFKGRHKTLQSLYEHHQKSRYKHTGHHGKIRYRYFDMVVEHHQLSKVKLVFLHTGKELLIFISTNLALSGKQVIETYKKRWNIEQGYKDLREHFGLGQEENRIYEALIARITISMFTYNLVSTINRLNHEPQTLGELFRDLECELEALAISMQLFLEILTKLSEVDAIVKENTNLIQIIALLRVYTQKELGFMCES
ncbi:IS4 family transposase, partial [Vibrio sp.]|uniref:IS4 family transposase n=1 Tax=Vibrio sp. TaxID=678 RepID=UPI003D13B346